MSTSGTSTPSRSRAVSPIPSKHPSRSTIRAGNSIKPVGGLLAKDNGRQRGTSPVGFGGIWEGGWTSSWSALQGLASSVLGVEVEGESRTSNGIVGKKPFRKVSAKSPDTWGPAGLPQKDSAVGAGTIAERDAAVRASKMRGILEGRDEDLNVQKDPNGNYKRRVSLDEIRTDEEQDDGGDALVYVHHVRPQDTLQGVILRYSCQPAVFRKANRFWPNDSIQTRKMVIVPVDACTIKGRPCEPPSPDSPNQGVDLLAPTPGIEEPPQFISDGTLPQASSSKLGMSAERLASQDEHPWLHVRWVLIDSSPSSKPVEIARMPRKTLGYFPPRRRKSQATISTVSTSRASSENPRSSLPNDIASSPSSTTSRRTSNLGPRPSQPIPGSYFPSTMKSSSRPRRESVSEAADRLGWMRGPGGVGTMGKNVRKPGPAQDGLNSWAKKHIPGLAIDSLPSTAILGGESAHFGFNEELGSIAEGSFAGGNGTITPTAANSSGLGLENAAAAIEGWVRKLAIKGPGTPKIGGGRGVEVTDLIELLDGAGSDDGRGFELNPGSLRASTPNFGSSGRDDLDGLARGRATAGAKGGKSD